MTRSLLFLLFSGTLCSAQDGTIKVKKNDPFPFTFNMFYQFSSISKDSSAAIFNEKEFSRTTDHKEIQAEVKKFSIDTAALLDRNTNGVCYMKLFSYLVVITYEKSSSVTASVTVYAEIPSYEKAEDLFNTFIKNGFVSETFHNDIPGAIPFPDASIKKYAQKDHHETDCIYRCFLIKTNSYWTFRFDTACFTN
jgi:hypothetical protein